MKKIIDSVKDSAKNDTGKNTTSPIETDHTISNAKDADELVHEQVPELPDMSSEQDIDDIVHTVPSATEHPRNEERDLDDLVHSQQEDEQDEKN